MYIYHVTEHFPGCLPDSPGTYYADENEAIEAYEALAFECANRPTLADMDEYPVGDLLREIDLAKFEEIDRDEIASIAEYIGASAAVIWAAALDGPYEGPKALSTQLATLGPWSWSPDLWASVEAIDVVATYLNGRGV